MSLLTMVELRGAFASVQLRARSAAVGMDNTDNLSADQLAMVFGAWGDERGLRCQLGYIADDGVPVLINTATVTTNDNDERIVRVWVYNNGLSLMGLMGHFEGIRRPIEGVDEEEE